MDWWDSHLKCLTGKRCALCRLNWSRTLDLFCIAYMAFEAQLGVTVALEVIQMYNWKFGLLYNLNRNFECFQYVDQINAEAFLQMTCEVCFGLKAQGGFKAGSFIAGRISFYHQVIDSFSAVVSKDTEPGMKCPMDIVHSLFWKGLSPFLSPHQDCDS